MWATHRSVRIAYRPAGSSWATRLLHRSDAKPPAHPVIAVDPAGNQVVAWTQGHTVRAMRRPAGGDWGPAAIIKVLPKNQSVISDLVLSVGRDGAALVTFWRGWVRRCRGVGEDCNIDNVRGVSVLHPASGSWTSLRSFAGPFDHVWGYDNPSLMPGGALVTTPSAVIGPSGTLTTCWMKPGYMGSGPVFARTWLAGTGWEGRIRLTDEGEETYSPPLLAATSWGQVTAVWTLGYRRGGTQSRTRPPGGPWGAIQRVSPRSLAVGLDVDGTGAATVLLMQERRHGDTATVTRPRNGVWGERTRIGRNGRYAVLAVDSTGEAVAAWQTATKVYASYRDSSQPWSQASRLGTKGTPLMSAAIGADDTAVVTWYRHAGPGEQNVLLKATVHAS